MMGGQRREGCCGRLWAACYLVLTNLALQQFMVHASLQDTLLVDQACLASAFQSLQANSSTCTIAGFNQTVLSCIGPSPSSDSYQAIQLLVPDSLLASLRNSAEVFFNDSGWKAELVGYTSPDGNQSLAKLLASPANILQAYDAWIVSPESLYDLFNSGLALNLSTIYNISNDSQLPQLHWSDVDRFYQTSALNDGYLTGIPLFGDVAAVFYRTNYINSSTAYAINTWSELLSTAAALNGTDFNNDGQPDYALCMPMSACRETGTLLGQILASTTQYKQTAQGWILNPANLNPLVGTPATMRALHILSELQKYSWPATGHCGTYTAGFVARKCAITIGGMQLFKQLQFNSNLRAGAVGYAPVPGSSMVLDRTLGYLVDCDPTLCPNAVWEAFQSGGKRKLSQAPAGQWVNRAPLWAPGGWMGMVNKNMPASNIWLAFSLLTTISSYSGSMPLVLSPTSPVGPARASHMPSTPDSTAAWSAAGYDPTDVASFMAVMNSSWHFGNVAYGLRMAGQDGVMAILQDVATSLLSGNQIGMVDTSLTAGINAVINNLPDKAQALDDYRIAINWHPPPVDNTTAADSGTKLNVAAVSVVGAAGGTGLLLIVIVSVYTWERRRRWGIGGKGAPRASPLTTIVVTDIENSTVLWEFVEHEIMNQCIDLHHGLVRALLRKHTGYESATEGDSFILAFHTPASALAFAESLQLGLMNIAWPEELLDNPLAEAVWMKAIAATNFATGLVMPATNNGAFSRDSLAQPSTVQTRQAPSLSAPEMMIKTALDASSKPNSFPGIASIEMQAVQPLTDRTDSRLSSHNTPPLRGDSVDSSRLKVEALVQPGKSFLRQATKASGIELEIKIDDQPHSGGGGAGGGAFQIIPTTPSALPQPVAKPGTVLELFMTKWQLVTKVPKKRQDPNVKLAFKGLRVRIGMHTGIDNPEDAENDKTTGRTQYGGIPLMTAKTVGDSGHGGMILMTLDTFEKLPSEFLRSFGMILNMGDYHWPGTAVPPKTVYQVVIEGLEQRLAIMQPVLRNSVALQRGSLLAPIGDATIVFVNMVGAATLRAWDREVADEAIALYENLAVDLLLGTGSARNSHPGRRDSQVSLRAALPNLTGDGGYLVELSHGLCLAAFTSPAAAILWALRLLQRMKVADWSDDILSHELCEQVTVAVQNSVTVRLPGLHPPDAVPEEAVAEPSNSGASTSKVPKLAQILFRGPRVRIGIDHGTVHPNINPVTGRIAYRGKVMNRAARVGGKAGCGQVWCSHTTWQHATRQAGPELPEHVEFQHLGAFSLKGVSESLDLVQCIAKNNSNLMADITSGTLVGSRAPSMQASEQLHSLQPEASSAHGIPPRSSMVVYSNPLLSGHVHGSFAMHDAASEISFMHLEAHGSNMTGMAKSGMDPSEQLQRQVRSFEEQHGEQQDAIFDKDAFANPDPRYGFHAGESSGDMPQREQYSGRGVGHSRLSSHSSIILSGTPSRDLAQFVHQPPDVAPLAAATVLHTVDTDTRANWAPAMNAEVMNNRRRSLHVHGYQQHHLAAVSRAQSNDDGLLAEDHGVVPRSPDLPKPTGWRALQAFAGRAMPLGVRKSARRMSATQIIEEERPARIVSFVDPDMGDRTVG